MIVGTLKVISDSVRAMDRFHPVHSMVHLEDTRGLERLAKIQATSRPENTWPEIWSGMSKKSQHEEKQDLAEKPKLDNARRL